MRKTENKSEYATILPGTTYSPWRSDLLFREHYAKIQKHTLVDIYRCYELWELVAQSLKSKGALLEVGVWRGGTASIIAKQASLSGIKDTVYLCDTFEGVVKTGEEDPDYTGGEHSDTTRDIVIDLAKELKLHNICVLKGIFPDDTQKEIKAKSFRFCHIDVDALQSAKDIFEWVIPKMSVKGIIVFDDYGFESTKGITKYVNSLQSRKDLIFIHNLNGHAVFIKTV